MALIGYADNQKYLTAQHEVDLIDAARGGNPQAFNRLVMSYQDRIFNLAARILGDEDLADDIAQNTFLAAYLNLSRFRNGSFRSWLYRIATNACYDEFRRRKKYIVQSIETGDYDEERLSPMYDFSATSVLPEKESERREVEQDIQHALSELDPDQRAVIVLVDQQELDYQEAAQVLGVPIGTVKSRLARARLHLRQLLTRDDIAANMPHYAFERVYVE